MTYFFILGNNPILSIAEIINVLLKKIDKVEQISSEFMLLKLKQQIDPLSLQSQLGGTVKIGQIFDQVRLEPTSDLVNEILKFLPKNLSKIYFGFSFYNPDKQGKSISRKKVEKIGLETKKALRKQNVNCRWVESSERVLSSVVVKKNKLLTQGAEIVFLISKDKVFMGRTLSCQAFEKYSWRDFGRPDRVIKKGMIPPKLAQIMINLSTGPYFSPEKVLFLDPFCGSGTILQEAFLMGFKNIIGTDKDKRAIISAQKNLQWLAEKLKKPLKGIKIFCSDVRKLSKKIRPNSAGMIVTEPYLGPLRLSSSNYRFIIRELSQLYILAFAQFKKILKPNRKVVIIFPVFKIKNKQYFLPILDQLKKMDWQVQPPLPLFLRRNSVARATERQSIIYSRPDQRILREIFIFKLSEYEKRTDN